MIGSKLVNRYEIASELGRGGMGVVYRGRDPVLNREVAIKLIPPALLSPDAEQRFQREAQLVAQMDHPAIVPIHDFGSHEGSLFFVMPVVQGTNLRNYLRQQSILGDIVDIGIQVAEALEYSHARGVVHRDIKPENIMVAREEPGGVRVRVMDFGLARASTESRLTKTGTLVGTLAYLSPEQVSAREIDARSDIYSLGTVLYEAVVGEPPFSGEMQSVLYRIIHEFAQSPRALGAAIDQELEQVILACLAKEPGQRPQTAAEVAEALKRYRARLRESDRAMPVAGLSRTMQTLRPASSPFVGRGREFGELQQRLNAAIAGESQFVVVGGEPGIGKTRLLDELESLARARKIRVLHGRSVEQDRAFPYQGFCDLIQEFFRLKDSGSAPPPDLSDLAADLVSLFPMLSEISEIRQAATGDSSIARPGGASGPENRTQVFELLARTLTRMAGGRPLLLFLEDLHAAEVSIEALQYVARRLGPTPTLVVGTYRTTEVDARHPLSRVLESFSGDRRFVSLTLGPFSPSEHRLFLETLVGGPRLADGLVQKLYEGTEGNPFFTKELVHSLLDSGGIARDDNGAWSLSGEVALAAEALPATIQQAIEKRIERLPEDLREVLAVASVIGRSFDSRELEKLSEGKTDVEDALDRLVRDGYLEEARESRGDVLTFGSGVVRDVLYAGLSRRKRRSLHRRYAELVEARHAGRLERVLPQLVHHFFQGDVPDKAVEYGLRLAKASLDAFSPDEAMRSAKTALEFLDEEWEGDRSREGEARMLLARAHRMAGDIDGALREAGAAIRIFEEGSQNARAVAALVLAAETAWQARRSEEAGRWVERGLVAARVGGAAEDLRQLLSLAATLANLMGEYAKANEYLEEAGRLAPEARETEWEEQVPPGGTLIVALADPVAAREPGAIRIIEEEEVLANVYETLLLTDDQGHVVPALCERWEVREEGRSFLLTLREGVRFSDGSPLAAADVKASFERSIRQAQSQIPAAFAAIRGLAEFIEKGADGVAGIVARSAREVEIQLTEPLPIYPALLSHQRTAIVRAASAEAPVVGTGPFRMASHAPEGIVLERNPEYWKGTPARLDGIEFRAGLRASAIAAGLRAGEFDLARDLLPEDLEELLRGSRFRGGFVEAAKENTYFVLFNSRTGPLARNAAVRRALSGVLRTQDLVWRALGRFAQPAVCLIPPGMLGHDAGRRNPVLSRDEARELLNTAGVGATIRLPAAVHPLVQDRYGLLLTRVFAVWSDLGVEVEVKTPRMPEYLASMEDNDGLDLMIGRWNADYDDPDNFTHVLFHGKAGRWRRWFSSTACDQILEEARAQTRPAAREALYRKFEGLLQESAALVPLFHDIDYRLASPKVRGLNLRGTAPYVDFTQVGKAEAAAPAEAVRAQGGTLHVPMVGVVTSIDPALTDTLEQAEVNPAVFETLTRVETGGAGVVPSLAAEWKAEDGGRRYRFRLRDDVRFHDGRRLSARDVRYSYERMLQQRACQNRWVFAPIKGAKQLLEGEAGDLAGFRIHSTNEFSIELEEPVAFFPALVSNTVAAIVPEGADPAAEGGPAAWVGTGPFRVAAFEPGRRLELERYRGYWRKGYPRGEGLVFDFGVSPEEMLTGLRGGRFSIASDLFPADVEVLRRDPDFASSYRETPRLVTYYVAFNRNRGPLADRALRQRLLQAVDAPKLVRQTLGRLAIPAHGLIPPGLLGHDPTPPSRTGAAPAPSSPAAPLELTAVVNPVYLAGYSALFRELTGALAQAGVTVRIVNKTMAEFMESLKVGSTDLSIGRWGADYPDADTFAYTLQSQGGSVGRLCGSPDLDRLLARGRAEASPAVRHSVYREMEEILAREAVLLPLFHEQAYRFARPEVAGLAVSLGYPTVAYENLHIRG